MFLRTLVGDWGMFASKIGGHRMCTAKNTKRPIGGTDALLTDGQERELERCALELSGHLFTPRLRNGRRIGIVLDDASFRQVCGRGVGYRGVATDLNTGNLYEIAGTPCSLAGCVCDAVAIKMNTSRLT
jgi:hypothetical protein